MNIILNKTQIDNPIIESFADFFKRFGMSKILRRCGSVKKFGVSASIVFLFILGLVFENKKFSTLTRYYDEKMPFGKDVVYRYLGQLNVNWERMVFLTASAVIPEIKKLTSAERKNALIFDDTTQYRNRSKNVEMLARCHDHVENKYYKGHTLLTMGWTDGQSFVPADYRVLSASDDKNLLHGSDFLEDNRTITTRRRKDARRGKPALILDMLRNVKGSNADSQYVMFDSWFSSPSLILQICALDFDVVSRLKNDKTKYLHNGEMMNLKKIYSDNRKRCGRAKYLLSVDIEISHKDHGTIPARVVFVRNKNKRSEWIALVSTDLSLNEEEIIALYGKRWDIEVFFKVCKSFLKLGKEFQCRSFDSTSALVAIVFIRYMKLAVESRENRDARSLGELFIYCTKELEDISFNHSIALLLEIFANYMRDTLCLSNKFISSAIDDFVSSLSCVFAGSGLVNWCES